MKERYTKLLPEGFVLIFIALAWSFPTNAAQSAPPLYWCPEKPPDQQYSFNPAPGCMPFVDKQEERSRAERRQSQGKAYSEIKLETIESETSKFLQQYRQFLDCCTTDLGSLDELQDLEDQASDLLKAVQETNLLHEGSPYSNRTQRQFTISQIIRTVAQARDDLRQLKSRLNQLGESMEKADKLDYETAGKVRRRIEEEKEAIAKEFRFRRPPDSARTGTEIQDTTVPNRIGTKSADTTLPNAFGEDIGTVASPNTDQQRSLHPRVGMDSVDTTIPSRPGHTSQDTTLPYSFGFEVNEKENPSGSSTTPSRVGPAIGDSSSNKRP